MLEEVVIRNTFLAKFRYKHDNFRFLLFSVLRKISCYRCTDSTTWVLIISYEIALRELRFLKRQAAQGTALVSLACEDAGIEIVYTYFDIRALCSIQYFEGWHFCLMIQWAVFGKVNRFGSGPLKAYMYPRQVAQSPFI